MLASSEAFLISTLQEHRVSPIIPIHCCIFVSAGHHFNSIQHTLACQRIGLNHTGALWTRMRVAVCPDYCLLDGWPSIPSFNQPTPPSPAPSPRPSQFPIARAKAVSLAIPYPLLFFSHPFAITAHPTPPLSPLLLSMPLMLAVSLRWCHYSSSFQPWLSCH